MLSTTVYEKTHINACYHETQDTRDKEKILKSFQREKNKVIYKGFAMSMS